MKALIMENTAQMNLTTVRIKFNCSKNFRKSTKSFISIHLDQLGKV